MLQSFIRQDLIRAVKEKFSRREEVDTYQVRPEILESWTRSRDRGIDIFATDQNILPSTLLEKRVLEQHDFYDIAVSFMESLYTFTAGSGFLIVLADAEGYVLKTIGDDNIQSQAILNGMVEGCNRSESRIGTDAIGTAIVTGKPIQVSGQEHYCNPGVNWVCSGAPIFAAGGEGEPGEIAGVICIIGKYEKVSFHTLGMAVAASEAIGRELTMKSAHAMIEKNQKNMAVIVEHIQSGLLLIDSGFKIKQANRKAEKFLGFQRDELQGKTFEQAFGEGVTELFQLKAGVSYRDITVQRDGQSATFSLSSMPAESGEYVVTFEKIEAVHKKVNKIIGAEASFRFDDIVGDSAAMRATVALAKIAAENNSSVLLTGESGTGKELFAQAIHNASNRSEGPFVAINCGALPKSLIESELFGFEGGSFTGARKSGSAGKFELANGGTIFLDEIGDMPFDVQVSLLRVLQNREIARIGSTRTIKIDVRIIAATNQNLQEAIRNNAFRSDLYYRLNVFNIQIPPLRDRVGDIRLLADYFLDKYSAFTQHQIKGFADAAYALMDGYRWPGNIRQLENAVERATYIAKRGRIEPHCLPGALMAAPADLPAAHENTVLEPMGKAKTSGRILLENEKKAIEDAIRETGGNIKKAAEILGISRKTIYRKIEKHGIYTDALRAEL